MTLSIACRHRRTILAALVAAFSGVLPLLAGPAAQAGPSLYVTSFPMRSTQRACLSRTQQLLVEAGMTEDGVRPSTTKDSRGRSVQNGWWAEHPEQDITAQFECDASNRMGSLGVAGADNDEVYALYERLWDRLMDE